MQITEQKIVSLIAFFIKNTHNCRKTKLFKLLYFVDFIHFKLYGRSVTGYHYITMPQGPVPIELYEQMTKNKLPELLAKTVSVYEEKDEDDQSKGFKFSLRSGVKVELDWLTPNEQAIALLVADIYKEATAKEISEVTHLHNSPWSQTIRDAGMGQVISYELALDDEITLSKEELLERAQLNDELRKHGSV